MTPDEWIDFFKKFLNVKLELEKNSDERAQIDGWMQHLDATLAAEDTPEEDTEEDGPNPWSESSSDEFRYQCPI